MTAIKRYLGSIQIQSALLWAAAILGFSLIPNKENGLMLLISLAGFHVVLMSRLGRKKSC
ncbi:MAG: hypothetical protein KTR13_01610 [Saprospiraceae bacterium]|nr:hypothetical protein [Saprospiraceae bacterium]